MSPSRFEKLKSDLLAFAGEFSDSALVAWVSSQFDLRKNPDGLTPKQVLDEIEKIRTA